MVLLKEVQGRQAWTILHVTALSYSDQPSDDEQKAMVVYVQNFANGTMLCPECRQHWSEMVAANPPDVSGRKAFYKWTVDRHNEVSRRLKKTEYTYEQALEETQKNAKTTNQTVTRDNSLFLAMGFIVGVVLFGGK